MPDSEIAYRVLPPVELAGRGRSGLKSTGKW